MRNTKPAMTGYILSLTLPNFVLDNPAVAILLPVLAGTAVGFFPLDLSSPPAYGCFSQNERTHPFEVDLPVGIAMSTFL